jgi:DNA-directed RNA polymerase subunit RPC12/RpoP
MSSIRPKETGEGLLCELLTRRDIDQAARFAARGNDPEQVDRLIRVDDDNTAWLAQVVDLVGWPGRSLVGAEGAHAAWLLAQHADRHPALQERWLTLLEKAAAAGEASPADFACLTDRVLLARGEPQVYGTQTTARDGRFVPCRLGEPDTVDQRRALVGLGTLESHLQDMLDLYGPPTPAVFGCPQCRAEIEVWPPDVGGQSTIRCPSCGSVTTIKARINSTPR